MQMYPWYVVSTDASIAFQNLPSIGCLMLFNLCARDVIAVSIYIYINTSAESCVYVHVPRVYARATFAHPLALLF